MGSWTCNLLQQGSCLKKLPVGGHINNLWYSCRLKARRSRKRQSAWPSISESCLCPFAIPDCVVPCLRWGREHTKAQHVTLKNTFIVHVFTSMDSSFSHLAVIRFMGAGGWSQSSCGEQTKHITCNQQHSHQQVAFYFRACVCEYACSLACVPTTVEKKNL